MSSPDKLPLAQQALNTLIDQLRPQDRVGIVVYAGAAGAVLQPTPGDQRLRIRCAVNALRAGGSTAGGAGLALAYRMAEASIMRWARSSIGWAASWSSATSATRR